MDLHTGVEYLTSDIDKYISQVVYDAGVTNISAAVVKIGDCYFTEVNQPFDSKQIVLDVKFDKEGNLVRSQHCFPVEDKFLVMRDRARLWFSAETLLYHEEQEGHKCARIIDYESRIFKCDENRFWKVSQKCEELTFGAGT